jgi:hypothetical protein
LLGLWTAGYAENWLTNFGRLKEDEGTWVPISLMIESRCCSRSTFALAFRLTIVLTLVLFQLVTRDFSSLCPLLELLVLFTLPAKDLSC